ncbi:MAG: glycosyltransferase, partial [Deltaproteobacteria bacterium]|nr:glycosyltransferase [Deltaproteobacteria bacterium]
MPVSLSVGIPNYNHAHYLERCITAVMTQDRLPDEVIVYDDCSTDNSLEVLAGLQERWPLLRVVRGERNRGVVAVGNDLAGMAQGEWLVLRAADD